MEYLQILLIPPPVTLLCLVLVGVFTKLEDWARLVALLLAFLVLGFVSALMLPGQFKEDEDIANGLLVFIWLYRFFWFSVVAAISLLPLGGVADRLIERIEIIRRSPVEDTFE